MPPSSQATSHDESVSSSLGTHGSRADTIAEMERRNITAPNESEYSRSSAADGPMSSASSSTTQAADTFDDSHTYPSNNNNHNDHHYPGSSASPTATRFAANPASAETVSSFGAQFEAPATVAGAGQDDVEDVLAPGSLPPPPVAVEDTMRVVRGMREEMDRERMAAFPPPTGPMGRGAGFL